MGGVPGGLRLIAGGDVAGRVAGRLQSLWWARHTGPENVNLPLLLGVEVVVIHLHDGSRPAGIVGLHHVPLARRVNGDA